MARQLESAADLEQVAARDQDPMMESGIAPSAFRLSAGLKLGHVVLQVASLARSVEYYQRVLGLRVIEESPGRAMLGAGGKADPSLVDQDDRLVELIERPNVRPAHGRLGLYHYAILLPDRAALGRFVAHLAAIGERAGASDHLVSEALYLRDPDGLGIEVYADRPRSTWRVRDRQLQMASEPLNFPDVVAAANGAPWDGMPQGTTMGHVHLHVGDLDAAAAFYHAALGLDKMVWAYPGALFLAAGGYHHHLGLNIWAGANAPPAGESDARLLEWRMVLPTPEDAREAASSLLSSGYKVVQESDTWVATDPWGTSVRLLQG